MLFDYDDTSIESILNYAKKLKNKTFREILNEYENSPVKKYVHQHDKINLTVAEEIIDYNSNTKSKGQLGNFLEKYYFGYDMNNKQDADFDKVGIELKQTCIDKTKKGKYRAGERLSITNISFKKTVIDDFYQSHVWKKIKLILLVHYLREKNIDRLDYQTRL